MINKHEIDSFYIVLLYYYFLL